MNINPANNAWYRQEVIDVSTRRRVRVRESCRSKEFSNCDICYTCRFFNASDGKCYLSVKNVLRIDPDCVPWKGFFVPVHIKKPAWYRCKWWKERK